jgi:hypothetical protein
MKTDIDQYRAIHDAATALGAECNSSCVWFAGDPQVKSAKVRARALMFLHELGRDIHPG